MFFDYFSIYTNYFTDSFLIVILLSLPFFAIAELVDLKNKFIINIPLSSLMFICPTVAVLVFDKTFIKYHIARIFDLPKNNRFFLISAVLGLLPILIFITYLTMKFAGIYLPSVEVNVLDIVTLFTLFFITSIFEELGWTDFLTSPLLQNFSTLITGILIGFLWAIWHIIPYLQKEESFNWIFWQCTTTILLRILMVWVFVRSDRNLFLVILFHTMINIVEFFFPQMGSHYDPFYFSMILLPVTMIIFFMETIILKQKILIL